MTAPLSEYLGSHIYQILGIDTHETLLGVRNDKLVVACKDFCENEGSLREIRTLKNIYNKELSAKLEESFSSTSSSHSVDINELLTHFEYNPVLQAIPDIKGLYDAIQRNVPVIQERMDDIKQFIWEIPLKHNDLLICSDNRKAFYIKSMEMRLDNYLSPALEMVNSKNRSEYAEEKEVVYDDGEDEEEEMEMY